MSYSPFRHLDSVIVKNKPIQLTLFLTRRCNAQCPFCFYLSKDRSQSAKKELSLNEIERISLSLGKLLWLAFSGGEIFLRQDLAEICRIFYQRNKPAIILLPTNGLLPEVIYKTTEDILQNCPKSTVVVKLSLDGPQGLHDSLRGVPGAYEQTIASYNHLKVLLERYDNFELGINSVFCAANQEKMAGLIDFVSTFEKITTHTVSLIRGEMLDEGQKKVSPENYKRIITLLEKNLTKKHAAKYRFSGARLKTAQDILQRRLIHKTFIRKKQLIPCYAGKLTLVITETGDVYPCESFERCLGNLRKTDFDLQRIIKGEKSRQALAAIKNKECYCTHECYTMINILFNPKLYPALLYKYIKLTPY